MAFIGCQTTFYISTLQWNTSKMDTIGEITVLYKEVSFIQGFLNYDILVTNHKSGKFHVKKFEFKTFVLKNFRESLTL